ncbi:MAG: helix-turn-helix domain-containing protein [Clostridia bacterium]|nr:helix-turn-helix domain-containing protein [Clostridia bacterium]
MKLLSHYLQNKNDPRHEITNWENDLINDSLCYSYRSTVYDVNTFPSSLHSHDYYELVIFVEGEINYVCESSVYSPKRGDVIIIPPGKFHMSKLKGERTHYKRHVFYLYPNAFDAVGASLADILIRTGEGVRFSLPSREREEELLTLTEKLSSALKKREDGLSRALAFGYIIEIFCLLNRKDIRHSGESERLPENILALQQYLDAHYTEINSVSEVAEHFFYSREYVSRLFKKYYDTTILDYIHKLRISKSRALIAEGMPIIDVCYAVGFSSLSTFIRAFRTATDMTPSEYRRMVRDGG